jgi:predicted 3-demethylubiquinone-9 3-methyltransferase (glyoxalase superfamily)
MATSTSIATFLMFEGKAEEAMNFYVSLFPSSVISNVARYGPGEQGAEGSVKRADFTLAGHRMCCIDSPIKHKFTFTPAISLYTDCTDEADIDRKFEQLSAEGSILMPLANYGFSTKFGWVQDRYGVSWQLNLT